MSNTLENQTYWCGCKVPFTLPEPSLEGYTKPGRYFDITTIRADCAENRALLSPACMAEIDLILSVRIHECRKRARGFPARGKHEDSQFRQAMLDQGESEAARDELERKIWSALEVWAEQEGALQLLGGEHLSVPGGYLM
ncbi:MAG: hypothetical protein MMC23_004294 [Stictis urceolatum]|nr:hypothetical protein [Stictis urceolata]